MRSSPRFQLSIPSTTPDSSILDHILQPSTITSLIIYGVRYATVTVTAITNGWLGGVRAVPGSDFARGFPST